MKVLKAIGNFFVKIWKWILKTAWIQPLLIVGLLFGVIFSIPPIVNAVKNRSSSDNPTEFLTDRNLSYEKINKTGGSSEIEGFVKSLSAAIDDSSKQMDSKYGQKFYLTFSQENCSGCEDVATGTAKLKDEWGKGLDFTPVNKDGNKNDDKFSLFNIQCDLELEDYDINDFITSGTNDNPSFYAFNTILLNGLDTILDEAAARAEETDYFFGLTASEQTNFRTKLEDMTGGDVMSFQTPLVIVFDFTEEGRTYSGGSGIREVFFSVENAYSASSSTESRERGFAKFFMDSWNATGKFKDER